MKGSWKNLALRVAPVLWALLVTLWPKPSELPPAQANVRRGGVGEGLYKAAETKANFGLLGVNFYESNNGQRRWHIESEQAELHRKENYAAFQTVMAEFFAERTGNVVLTKSDAGQAWTDKSRVELQGNVSVESQKGYLFTMNRLFYDGKTHEFSTDDKVDMVGPDVKIPIMFLSGVGMQADIDTERFILKKSVQAKKALKDGNWMRITSRAGEFFTNESRAIFQGGVHAVMPTAIIDSNRFEMTVGKANDELHATGNVVFKSKDKVGRAHNMFLEVGGNEVILEGNARIDSKGNHLQGRRIRLYTDEDRIEVEDAMGRGGHGSKN